MIDMHLALKWITEDYEIWKQVIEYSILTGRQDTINEF